MRRVSNENAGKNRLTFPRVSVTCQKASLAVFMVYISQNVDICILLSNPIIPIPSPLSLGIGIDYHDEHNPFHVSVVCQKITKNA